MSGMIMGSTNTSSNEETEKNQENSSLPPNVNFNIYMPGETTFMPLEVAEYLERIEKPVPVSFDDIISGQTAVSFTKGQIPSIPSKLLTVADLPEVTINDNKTKFIYNRFEPDEGVSRTDLSSVNSRVRRNNNAQSDFVSLASAEQSGRLDSRYTSPARYINIDFSFNAPTGTSFATLGSNINNFPLTAGGSGNNPHILISKIDEIIGKIDPSQVLVEGGLYSFYYSGTELVDTALDETFYTFLAHSLYFNDIINDNTNVSNSLKSTLDRHVSQLQDQNEVPAIDESLFREIKVMMSQKGFNVRSKTEKMLDSVKTMSHNLAFHNVFFDSIVKASSDMRVSVYEDEVRAYSQYTPQIYSNVVNNLEANSVDESEFATQIGSTYIYDYLADDLDLPHVHMTPANLKPGVVHIGYMIQKTEIIGSRTRVMSPILRGLNTTKFIDTNVAYGATYVYKIRSLFLVEYDCLTESQQVVRASFVIGSQGSDKIIPCLENVAPKPPQSVRFKYDHKSKGLNISWEFPPNPQGDIKGFQVFRRKSINQPFTMIMEYDFDNSVVKIPRKEIASRTSYKKLIDNNGLNYVLTNFIDESFNKKSEFIYAIGCFDAHGLVSNFSAQFKVKYNNKKRKVDISLVSRQKAPRPYPNMFLEEDVMQDAIKVSGKNRMTTYFNPEYYKIFSYLDPDNPTNLKLINTTTENIVTHKIHFVNTDLQKGQLLDIVVKDNSTPSGDFGLPYLEKNNLSFTLKLDQ